MKKFNKKEYDKYYRETHREQGKKCYCKDCKTKIWYGSIRCKSCARKYQYKINPDSNPMKGKFGKQHPAFNGGQKYFCLDCGKKINFDAKRCQKHARIYQYKNNPETHPMKDKHHTKSSLKKISEALKKLWKNVEYRNKAITLSRKNMHLKPNKPEKTLNKLLNKLFPNEYKYNKTFIIAGLVPDFIDEREKKIIELYGCYWHKCSKCGFGNGRKEDKNREGIYDLFANYKTLIVWEHELENIELLTNKLLSFIKKD